MFLDLFPDPTTRFLCSAEGDDPPAEVAGGGTPSPAQPPDPATDAAAARSQEIADGADGDGEQDQKPPAVDWRDRQIDRQHRKIKDAEERLARFAELEAENARLRQLAEAATRRTGGESPPPPSATPPIPPPTIDESIIEQRVQARLAEREVKEIENIVKRDYGKEWPEALQNYQTILGQSTNPMEVALRQSIMNTILSTDDAAYTLIAIGKDPATLQELADLPEGRRNKKIYDISNTKPKSAVTTPKPVLQRPSGAPPPPVPPPPGGGGPPLGTVDLYDPRLEFSVAAAQDPIMDAQTNKAADDAWFAERQRQKRESTGRPWSVGGQSGSRR